MNRPRVVEEEEETLPFETFEEKFKRLANDRVERTVHLMERIENLAKKPYEYSKEDADRVVEALAIAFDSVRRAFNKEKVKRPKFSL